MIRSWLKFFWAIFVFCVAIPASAQFDEGDSIQQDANVEVESLYDSFDRQEEKKQKAKVRRKRRVEKKSFTTLSSLGELEPFSDIAVISRKYLPKTSRFELGVSGMGSINNAFFTNLGGSLRGAYYFREKLGIEAMYYLMTTSRRSITTSLKEKRSVDTRSLVVPESFYGLSFKWVPIYGKMALLNKTIVPFDIYFSPGLGFTNTAEGNSEATIHLEVGQIFALSKSMAFRWDFSWNFYQASATQTTNSVETEITAQQSDLFLGFGMSFFFPEATYR